MPAGWTATEAGYFGTVADGRDTLAALQTYRLTADKWQAAHQDLSKEFTKNAKTVQEQIKGLEAQINAERRAWKAEVTRSRTQSLIWGIIIGAGAATMVRR